MARYLPDFPEFERLAQRGNTVPVYCQLMSDSLTPVTAFAAVSQESPHAFLLESVVGGVDVARYSFLAADPQVTFEATRDRVTVEGSQGRQQEECKDPLSRLAKMLESYRAVHLPELPRFSGGV